MKRTNFKEIPQDKRLVGVGNLFRENGSDDFWRVTAHFNDECNGLESVPLNVEMSSLLGLGRKFSIADGAAPYEKMKLFKIMGLPPVSEWVEKPLGQFPRLSRSAAESTEIASQKCYVMEAEGLRLWLPKFELARKLFFHAGSLVRAALVPNGLGMLFNVEHDVDGYDTKISTAPKSGIPAAYFRRSEYRSFFAWLLLNSDIRQSFESIWQCLNEEQTSHNGGLSWTFNFRPPNDLPCLRGVIRGPLFPDIKEMLIWEIDSIWNLPNADHGKVLFYHPEVKRSGRVQGVDLKDFGEHSLGHEDLQVEVNSEEDPKSGRQRQLLNLPPERLSFTSDTDTHVFYNKAKPFFFDPGLTPDLFMSLKDDSEEGLLKPADLAQLGDENLLEQHSRFGPLLNVILALEQFEHLKLLDLKVSALPRLKRCKHYMLDEKTPRCYLLAKFRVDGKLTRYVLEIDTSDNLTNLSTKIIQVRPGASETGAINEILAYAVKQSLQWPNGEIHRLCCYVKEVVHPRLVDGQLCLSAETKWLSRIADLLAMNK